ncbi:dienelactone hydrolase family protein [Amycolatopsis alkalitolerans]|uniref:Dienelactone hydrolase family protein n=1 Tax=Amycolatopsis alkalitolerans TaxID=2547244 RepID=A0A5C4M1W9_9PSEU|nr:dienelactone hydrolase family protein [Amycolatopsis alkalitolerans]TNC26052.1 dienelactone hydrolase family protein [Amycolatopsis alkalitolerans]
MDIPVADGTIRGYLARPQTEVSGEPPRPGVVVIHDAVGLTEDARNITERFATAGYLALAPDLFSRGGLFRCVKTVFRELATAKGRAFEDISAARRLLAERADCTGKVGVVGFCMGGGFALVAATQGFDASAPYYGQLPKDLSILDEACPVVASFGKRDPSLKGTAAKLEQELTDRGIPHDIKEYPDAGHSFANQFPIGPLNVLARYAGVGYHRESSEDAWRRVLAFFARHLR